MGAVNAPPDATSRTDADVPAGAEILLRAVGAPSPATLETWLARFPPTPEVVEWLDRQGLAPLAFHHLATNGLLGRLDPTVAEALHRLAVLAIVAELVRGPELGRVMLALEAAGVEFVLLKGSVLAFTVYPDPSCRFRSDIDAWIDPADHERAAPALASLGYAHVETPGRPHTLALSFAGEAQMRGPGPGQRLLELHFQAFVGEWCRLATRVDHKAIWARRVTFPPTGVTIPLSRQAAPRAGNAADRTPGAADTPAPPAAPVARGAMMAPEDQLLQLAVHFGINHQFADPNLRAVLDLHLLATTPGFDWQTLTVRARAWGIATVTWTALSLSARLFATPIPLEALSAVRPGPLRRALINNLHLDRDILHARGHGYTLRRGLQWLLMTDRLSLAWRFLARTVVPEAEWLRARWGAVSGAPILPLLARHWRSLLLERRS